MSKEVSVIPDLSDILDEIDFDKKPLSHGTPVSHQHFGVSKWGALIVELIAYPKEQDNILAAFGLTTFQLSELMGNQLFLSAYKDIESSMEALVANGAFQLSARRVAEQGLAVLEDIMVNGDDNARLKAVETAARLANLDPLVQAKLKEKAAVNTGVQLVVNFSDKLPIPSAFASGGDVVIDTKAEYIENE